MVANKPLEKNSGDFTPDIFHYLSYREYLRDFFAVNKKNKTGLTPKEALYAMGVSSTGFISNILAGRKNLTPSQVHSLLDAMQLSLAESSYFENLVWYTQARNLDEKNHLFAKLLQQQNANLKILSPEKHTVFSKWFFPFVREVLYFFPFKKGYHQLANMIQPKINAAEAKEAIDALAAMDLIEEDDSGFWHQKDPAISTGDEVRSRELARFQMTSMELARKALEEIAPEERDISTLTFSLSEKGFNELKKDIQYFRKKVARIAMEDTHVNRVYQFNLQLFPVSKKRESLGD